VLQDCYVKIWNHASDYAQAKSAPMTWMAAIVRNRSLDLVRRAREVPDVDDALASNLVDERATPAADAEARAESHSLRECLGELEAEQRQTIASPSTASPTQPRDPPRPPARHREDARARDHEAARCLARQAARCASHPRPPTRSPPST
jgi:hypothetical protein